MTRDEDWSERFEAIVQSVEPRDAKLWSLVELLEDALDLPAAARVAGDRVEITHVDYGGDEAQGLIAAVTNDDGVRSLPLSDVVLLNREPGAELVRAYRVWVRGRPADPAARAAAAVLPDTGPIELAVLAVLPRTARCRRMDDETDVVYRFSDREMLAPGTIITIAPKHREGRLEGPVEGTRIDARRLGLVPLSLTPVDDPPAAFVLNAPETPDQIEEAELLAEAGDPREARRILLALAAEDLQRLDVHAALGGLALAGTPETALAHFAVGAALGDLSVPDPLDGLLTWDQRGNRGYLACLYGCGRALHRLGRDEDAQRPLERLLALDPDDHLGATQLLIAAGGRAPL